MPVSASGAMGHPSNWARNHSSVIRAPSPGVSLCRTNRIPMMLLPAGSTATYPLTGPQNPAPPIGKARPTSVPSWARPSKNVISPAVLSTMRRRARSSIASADAWGSYATPRASIAPRISFNRSFDSIPSRSAACTAATTAVNTAATSAM
jgi:hypothetical protein